MFIRVSFIFFVFIKTVFFDVLLQPTSFQRLKTSVYKIEIKTNINYDNHALGTLLYYYYFPSVLNRNIFCATHNHMKP